MFETTSRRTSMTVAGQPAVYYTYDAVGRLTNIKRKVSNIDRSFNFTYG